MRPWEKRGFARGLHETVEMAISRGEQDAESMAGWIRRAWGNHAEPTTRQVLRARAKLRQDGSVTYSKADGWRLATPRSSASKQESQHASDQ